MLNNKYPATKWRTPRRALIACVLAALVIDVAATYRLDKAVNDSDRQNDNKAGWIPFRTYSPDIERALNALVPIHLDQYEYIRRNGVPIYQLNPKEYSKFGIGCNVATTIGCTSEGAIFLNDVAGRQIFPMDRVQSDVAFRAAIISHEVVHVQHHDPNGPSSSHPAWQHRYIRAEEGEAHVTGNWTLLRLVHERDLGPRLLILQFAVDEFINWTPFLLHSLRILLLTAMFFCIFAAAWRYSRDLGRCPAFQVRRKRAVELAGSASNVVGDQSSPR